MPHTLRLCSFILALLPLLATNLLAQDNVGEQSVDLESQIPPVVRLGSWSQYDVLRVDHPPIRKNTLVIKSAEQFAKYFQEDFAVKWREQVDFDEQELSVWIWNGSGEDELECFVSQTDPTKVLFRIERGVTKDCHSHLWIFAIRKDVKIVTGP